VQKRRTRLYLALALALALAHVLVLVLARILTLACVLTLALYPQAFMAEVFECLRRVMLTGGVVLIPVHTADGRTVRAFVGAALSLVFVATTSWAPYRDASANALAYAASVQNFFTYFAAFLLLSRPFGSVCKETLTINRR
jgi:hypothetical protein